MSVSALTGNRYYIASNCGEVIVDQGNIEPKTGAFLRRASKLVLTANPPKIGEMVFATDTGEHGWADENNVLQWKSLAEDKTTVVTTDCTCVPEHVHTVNENIYNDEFITLHQISYTNENKSLSYNINGYTDLVDTVTTVLQPAVTEILYDINGNVIYDSNGDPTINIITPEVITWTKTFKEYIWDMSGKFHIPNDLIEGELYASGIKLSSLRTLINYTETDSVYNNDRTIVKDQNIGDIEIYFLLSANGVLDIKARNIEFAKGNSVFYSDFHEQVSIRSISKTVYGRLA